jgi:hypothetical protein
VLGVGVGYLLTPPPGVGDIEMAPGVTEESVVIVEAITSPKGTDSTDEKFTETGLRFFQHLADLRQVLAQVQADMDAFVAELMAVHAARKDDSPGPRATAAQRETSLEAESS